MSQTDKIRVAVLFGGRSTEHEISIITALQVLEAFDSTRFETFPVYIDSEGHWYTGDLLRKRENFIPNEEQKAQLTRIQLAPEPGSEFVEVKQKKGLFAKEPRRFPVDIFFPAFHGTYGEDGCLQGLLEFMDATYVGCGPRASAIAMNKHATKQILSTLDIPVLPGLLIHQHEWDPDNAHLTAEEIIKNLSLPVIVKPCHLGSSIGVSSAHDEEQLMVSLAGAFAFDHQVLVEPFLEDMYELNIAVMGGEKIRLSVIERPLREDPVLTFEQKYIKGNNKMKSSDSSEGMASLQRDLDPADVPDSIKEEIRGYAARSYSGLDCRGAIRIDFVIDKKEEQVYLNEINPLPGSFSYYLWEDSTPKLTFTELLSELVEQAIQDKRSKKRIKRQLNRQIFKD